MRGFVAWVLAAVVHLMSLPAHAATGSSSDGVDKVAQGLGPLAAALPLVAQIEVWTAGADAPTGLGSAFPVTADCLCLTAWHVVSAAATDEAAGTSISVVVQGVRHAARLVGFDAVQDLAALRIHSPDRGRDGRLEWMDRPAPGELALIGGWAEGLANNGTIVTLGPVVAGRRLLHGLASNGQSGGPVFVQRKGQPVVAGVVVSRAFLSAISRAVPADVARAFAERHRDQQRAMTPAMVRRELMQQLVEHQQATLRQLQPLMQAAAVQVRSGETKLPQLGPERGCSGGASALKNALRTITVECSVEADVDTGGLATDSLAAFDGRRPGPCSPIRECSIAGRHGGGWTGWPVRRCRRCDGSRASSPRRVADI